MNVTISAGSCTIFGRAGNWLLMGANNQLLAVCATYHEASSLAAGVAAMGLRWKHSAKLHAIRVRRWNAARAR